MTSAEDMFALRLVRCIREKEWELGIYWEIAVFAKKQFMQMKDIYENPK